MKEFQKFPNVGKSPDEVYARDRQVLEDKIAAFDERLAVLRGVADSGNTEEERGQITLLIATREELAEKIKKLDAMHESGR